VCSQNIACDPVEPRPGIFVAGVITVPGSEGAYPDLAEQIVGGTLAGTPGQVPVDGDLVAADDLHERFRRSSQRLRDQRSVPHVSPLKSTVMAQAIALPG